RPGRPSWQENPQAVGWDARQKCADAIGAARRATCSGIAAGRRSVITARRKDICVENARKSPAAGIWMPCTRMPVEVIRRPGTKDECRIRMRCEMTPLEDYDLLIGMELLYHISATICTWQEKVLYRAQYWRDDGPVGTLPVHFVKREPRGAFQARMAEMDEQPEDWSWKQYVLEQEMRKAEEERDKRPLVLPPRLTDLGRLQEPITIVELFGGIGTGLAAASKQDER
ncbi:unnamed protein product, partial [Closterium sp. NIES-53]